MGNSLADIRPLQETLAIVARENRINDLLSDLNTIVRLQLYLLDAAYYDLIFFLGPSASAASARIHTTNFLFALVGH